MSGHLRLVTSVAAGSPAEKAGLQPEDVILRADDRVIEENNDLSRYIASRAPGTTVKLELLRGKDRKTVSVSLGTFQDGCQEGPESQGGRASLG